MFGLLQDSKGRIWISGGKGLRYSIPRQNQLLRLTPRTDCKIPTLTGCIFGARGGFVCIWGNSGFNVFDPIAIQTKNSYLPPIVLTQISKFNRPTLHRVHRKNGPASTRTRRFGCGVRIFGNGFHPTGKNQFRYRMVGFDDDWVDALGDRQATYTNLDAGDYRFEVMGSNNDGVWNRGPCPEYPYQPAIVANVVGLLAICRRLLFGAFLFLQNNTRRQRFAAEKRYSERLQLYVESLEQATDCILIADGSGKVLFANHAIGGLFGLAADLAVGRSIMSVVFTSERQAQIAQTAIDSGERFVDEIDQADAHQGPAIEVTMARVNDSMLSEAATVAIARDITRRKATEAELEDYRRNLESLVEERSRALQREMNEHKQARGDLAESLREKELLLKEVHHRVKNNMQVISSLLSLQSYKEQDQGLGSLLNESQQRIKSMALIHEGLYRSDNFLDIQFESYVRNLATDLCRFYSVEDIDIQLVVEVQDVRLGLDSAVPCGLIINELVTNCLNTGS